MSVAVVVASGGFRFRGLRFCKAVQVGRRMLSYCEARSWQVFSTRVSKHHMFSPLTLVKFFLFRKCARTNSSRHTPSAPLEQRGCLEPVLARALAPACVARHYGICTFAQTRESNLVLVRRWNAVPSHIQSSIKILGVKI